MNARYDYLIVKCGKNTEFLNNSDCVMTQNTKNLVFYFVLSMTCINFASK